MRTRLALVAALIPLAGCGSGSSLPTPSPSATSTIAAAPLKLWPAPADPLALTRAAGLAPEVKEHLEHHVHAHLDIFKDGRPVEVPGGIGINIHDPAVHRFETPDGASWGGIDPQKGCATACISPLHTHSADGILHTESSSAKLNTLGQFFTEWHVDLTSECVGQFCTPATSIAVVVDGVPFTGDPRSIELSDHREIAIVIGTPPAHIPMFADFSHA